MRRAIYAALAACAFTFVPIMILKLESETAIMRFLKSISAFLGIPGAFVGFLAAFGRVDDIDLWVTNVANFAFYFLITWLVLKVFDRSKTRRA